LYYNCTLFCFYDICNSTHILYIILWLSPHPWVVRVNGYIGKYMNEYWEYLLVSGRTRHVWEDPPFTACHYSNYILLLIKHLNLAWISLTLRLVLSTLVRYWSPISTFLTVLGEELKSFMPLHTILRNKINVLPIS
jgi:hypothetical protein